MPFEPIETPPMAEPIPNIVRAKTAYESAIILSRAAEDDFIDALHHAVFLGTGVAENPLSLPGIADRARQLCLKMGEEHDAIIAIRSRT